MCWGTAFSKLLHVSSEDSNQPENAGSLIRVITGQSVDSQGSKVSLSGQQRL